MGTRARAMLATAFALVALGSSTHAAGAEEALDITPAGNVTMASAGAITFAGGLFSVSCEVTFTGTLERDFVAKDEFDLGAVTGASGGRCTGTTLTFLTGGTPWELTVRSVLGTLPSAVTAFLVSLFRIAAQLVIAGVACLYEGRIDALLGVTGSSPYTSGSLTILGGAEHAIALVAGNGIFCPRTGTLAGTLSLTQQRAVPRRAALSDDGAHLFNRVGETHTFTFTNVSEGPVEIARTRISRGSSRFRVTAEGERAATACTRLARIAERVSCTVEVQWTRLENHNGLLRVDEPARKSLGGVQLLVP